MDAANDVVGVQFVDQMAGEPVGNARSAEDVSRKRLEWALDVVGLCSKYLFQSLLLGFFGAVFLLNAIWKMKKNSIESITTRETLLLNGTYSYRTLYNCPGDRRCCRRYSTRRAARHRCGPRRQCSAGAGGRHRCG